MLNRGSYNNTEIEMKFEQKFFEFKYKNKESTETQNSAGKRGHLRQRGNHYAPHVQGKQTVSRPVFRLKSFIIVHSHLEWIIYETC